MLQEGKSVFMVVSNPYSTDFAKTGTGPSRISKIALMMFDKCSQNTIVKNSHSKDFLRVSTEPAKLAM